MRFATQTPLQLSKLPLLMCGLSSAVPHNFPLKSHLQQRHRHHVRKAHAQPAGASTLNSHFHLVYTCKHCAIFKALPQRLAPVSRTPQEDTEAPQIWGTYPPQVSTALDPRRFATEDRVQQNCVLTHC